MTKDKDGLSHLDSEGRARMVDVGEKAVTARAAEASARVRMLPETFRMLVENRTPKGDVFATARIAGIQAAKRTPELIPLCHTIALTSCKVEFATDEATSSVTIRAIAKATDRTGVEMEALTAASIAALTLYDMLKAVDRAMVIESVQVEAKQGGASGNYVR